MNEFTMFDETDGEQYGDAFSACNAGELLAMGLIDETTMEQLMEPWSAEMEIAA